MPGLSHSVPSDKITSELCACLRNLKRNLKRDPEEEKEQFWAEGTACAKGWNRKKPLGALGAHVAQCEWAEDQGDEVPGSDVHGFRAEMRRT